MLPALSPGRVPLVTPCPGNPHLDSDAIDQFACFWTSYKWKHMAYALWGLASSSQLHVCGMRPCWCTWFYLSFFLAVQYSALWICHDLRPFESWWAFGYLTFGPLWQGGWWTLLFLATDAHVFALLLVLCLRVKLLCNGVCYGSG